MFKNHRNLGDSVFNAGVTIMAILALVTALYPLYFVLIASISQPEEILAGKVLFLPSGIDISGYRFVFRESAIWLGYRNTVIYAVFGTLLGVTVTMLAGYALSRKDLAGRGWIMKMMVFTMFFNGGLIPTYITVSKLRLVNTPFVLILLGSVWVFNIIITRTFFQSTLPDELLEAAYIDGCGNFRFFVSIVLPLSKAIIAVIALYYAIGHWNSYFNALIYVTDKELFPLQLVLRGLLVQGQQMVSSMDPSEIESLAERQRMAEIIKYCVIVVSSLPMICLYPFLQRYFVKGVMIGSVKA